MTVSSFFKLWNYLLKNQFNFWHNDIEITITLQVEISYYIGKLTRFSKFLTIGV
jgi:hypothetical protein